MYSSFSSGESSSKPGGGRVGGDISAVYRRLDQGRVIDGTRQRVGEPATSSEGRDTDTERRLAPTREDTDVLNRLKVSLAPLAAHANLTRSPRARQRAFIGASQGLANRCVDRLPVEPTEGHLRTAGRNEGRSAKAKGENHARDRTHAQHHH